MVREGYVSLYISLLLPSVVREDVLRSPLISVKNVCPFLCIVIKEDVLFSLSVEVFACLSVFIVGGGA